jgi:protein SCO1
MKKRVIFYFVFFALLIAVFYIVMVNITDLGKESLPPLNTVHPFSFLRQDGKMVTQKDLVGKTYVVEYFFTTCNGICPKMNRNMQKVYNELAYC